MTELTVVGVDIATRLFQIHEIDKTSGEILNKQIKRAKFLEFFSNRETCLIGMEACGGSQHWARKLTEMGHIVKLLPAQYVRPFVSGNKNDMADARAIWTAVQQPRIRSVGIKTETQQAVLAMHRIRQQLVRFRTAQCNVLHGLLLEYGEAFSKGRKALRDAFPGIVARLEGRIPDVVVDTFRDHFSRLSKLDQDILEVEDRLRLLFRHSESCKRIAEIPGVGFITATAIVAAMGDPKAFRSGREFAAWLGLVPRQIGTGGKIKLLGISKRGDTYLRTLLIHGARAALTQGKRLSDWVISLACRRHRNIAIVAMANKTARTIWAVLAHNERYNADYAALAR